MHTLPVLSGLGTRWAAAGHGSPARVSFSIRRWGYVSPTADLLVRFTTAKRAATGIMAVGSTLRGLYALLVAVSLLAVFVQADAVGDLQTKGRTAIDATLAKGTTCTKANVKVRKEWYVFLETGPGVETDGSLKG